LADCGDNAMTDSVEDVKAILAAVKPLAAKYYRLTGKPLGVTGEVAEYVAAQTLGLKLAPPRTAGYDAIRLTSHGEQRIQIKGRAYGEDAKPGQRMGRIKPTELCDAVLLVLLDNATLEPREMWEAPYAAVAARLAEPGSKARNERGALGVSEFKRMAKRIWPEDTPSKASEQPTIPTTSDPAKEAFLGETLFHFLGTGDADRLFGVLDSIARRGLLLTVGNKEGKLDTFKVPLVGGVAPLEVMQHARVCFTDIPEKLLAAHSEEYGKFGLGFTRKTILEWGGNPVIYLPNHPDPNTLETSMGSMLYCLHRVPLLMEALRACLRPLNASLTINQTTLTGADRDAYIDQAEHSVRRMWAFVKEMSSQDANDYRYLYEREWRIVDGALRQGGADVTRELSDDESRELGSACARWNQPLNMSAELSRQYPHKKMLQLFRFFNGLSDKTVSQAIDVILVPNAAIRDRVSAYIAAHPEAFCPGGPAVRAFGAPS
jgi:hypothetical protein